MRRYLCFFLVLFVNVTNLAFAYDGGRPWFAETDSNSLPSLDNSPMLDMIFVDDYGNEFSDEIIEDMPLTFTANSDIFKDEAPSGMGNSYEYFDQPQWIEGKTKTLWFVNDLDREISYMASSATELKANQMVIIPNNPSDRLEVSCYASRNMKYIREDGRTKIGTAKSNYVAKFKVKDITPPTCGLEISVEKGESGKVYPVETSTDYLTLQKSAEIHFSGALFSNSDVEKVADGYVLGDYMVIKNEDCEINLNKNDVLKVKVIENDNYKLDSASIKFGICGGAGGESSLISILNEPEIELSTLSLPDNTYLFLEAKDLEGNVQKLFIPLNIR